MEIPVILGKRATCLSDVVDYVDVGYGVYMYVVADCSGYFNNRADAFTLAREWFPDLEDDE